MTGIRKILTTLAASALFGGAAIAGGRAPAPRVGVPRDASAAIFKLGLGAQAAGDRSGTPLASPRRTRRGRRRRPDRTLSTAPGRP